MHQSFDDTWHRRALDGDGEAIDRLARHALQPLYRFCLYRVGRNQHLCEEVVQETLVAAIRQLDRYEPARAAGDVLPWLMGLARNVIRRVLSRESAANLEMLWQRMDDQLRSIYARLESEPLGDEVLRREETQPSLSSEICYDSWPEHVRSVIPCVGTYSRNVLRLGHSAATPGGREPPGG